MSAGPAHGTQQATIAPLHDVGKIAVLDDILLKPGSLTDSERAIMEEHARRQRTTSPRSA